MKLLRTISDAIEDPDSYPPMLNNL